MSVITRFAPSPTGLLHVGNIRVALLNYLLTKKHKGSFILRIDDTDRARSEERYAQAAQADVSWLGYKVDSSFKQSDKGLAYRQALDFLVVEGLAYECFETKEELEAKRALQLSKGRPPVYDRAALRLSEADKAKLKSEGRASYYRFKLLPQMVEWQDLVKGKVRVNPTSLSDPILVKENGEYLYTFCSVVDDLNSGITHIVRGEDHLSNTAVQIQLFRSLSQGRNDICFAHLPLLSMLDGSELSKRVGGNSIEQLREQGILPMAINNYLFMLGQAETGKLFKNLDELAEVFDLSCYGSSSVKFDHDKLLQINALILQGSEFQEVKPHLVSLGLAYITAEVWTLFKGNIRTLTELEHGHQVVKGELELSQSESLDADVLKIALQKLPAAEPTLSSAQVELWLEAIKAEAGVPNKVVFKTLRLALTGAEHGPGFKDLFTVIPRALMAHRLNHALALRE